MAIANNPFTQNNDNINAETNNTDTNVGVTSAPPVPPLEVTNNDPPQTDFTQGVSMQSGNMFQQPNPNQPSSEIPNNPFTGSSGVQQMDSQPSFGGQPQQQMAQPSFGGQAQPSFGGQPQQMAQPSFGGQAQPSFGGQPQQMAQPSFGGQAQPSFGGQPQQQMAQPSFGGQAQPAFGGQPQQQMAQPSFGGQAQPAFGGQVQQQMAQPSFGGPVQAPQGNYDNNQQHSQTKYILVDLFWMINKKQAYNEQFSQNEVALLTISYNASFANMRFTFYNADYNALLGSNQVIIQNAQRLTTANVSPENAVEMLMNKQTKVPVNIIERVIRPSNDWTPNMTSFVWMEDRAIIQTKDQQNNMYIYTFMGNQLIMLEYALGYMFNGQAWNMTLSSLMK